MSEDDPKKILDNQKISVFLDFASAVFNWGKLVYETRNDKDLTPEQKSEPYPKDRVSLCLDCQPH